MIQPYIVLGQGIQYLDDGLTDADHANAAAKKEKMKVIYDGKTYLGRCRDCGEWVWDRERYFYTVNKDGLGHVIVDVAHCHH